MHIHWFLDQKGQLEIYCFYTSISGSGCDCDESAPNPDDLCALDEKCKQCKCIPEGEGKTLYKLLSSKMRSFLSAAGCDCDDTSANPDELCPGDYKCNKCKCLPPGQLSIFNLHCLHYISIYMSTAIASYSL